MLSLLGCWLCLHECKEAGGIGSLQPVKMGCHAVIPDLQHVPINGTPCLGGTCRHCWGGYTSLKSFLNIECIQQHILFSKLP